LESPLSTNYPHSHKIHGKIKDFFDTKMIEIKALNEDRWQDYRALRLEALQKEPLAFGSSWEEESKSSEEEWRRRINNAFFAVTQDRLIGMIIWVQVTRIKSKHIANIYGVYVAEEYRLKGIGKQLMDTVLARIKENRDIKKIELAVNPVQKAAVKLYQNFGFKIAGQ
jgi:ribosomal protein S18 acetylase RimI-like enzyme